MKKIILATLSVATLLALSGCCKKKEATSTPTSMKKETASKTSMKKEDCCKKKAVCKKEKCGSCTKSHKGKMCDEKKSAHHAYLELEEADDVLL